MTVLSYQSLMTLGLSNSVGPSSIDLHLDGVELLRSPYGMTWDPEVDQSGVFDQTPLDDDGRWTLGQGRLYLGATAEIISVPDDMIAHLHGVSGLGRLGLLVHVTAGLADPGYLGRLTLELVSLTGRIRLRPGMVICQITYQYLDESTIHPYAGSYQDDHRVKPSQYFKRVHHG